MERLLIQEWVYKSTTDKEQAALISCLRGMDDKYGNDITKPVVKMLRYLITKSYEKKKYLNYTTDDVYEIKDIVNMIFSGWKVSLHWFDHIKLAIQAIKLKHPNNYVRKYWSEVYTQVMILIDDFQRHTKMLEENSIIKEGDDNEEHY